MISLKNKSFRMWFFALSDTVGNFDSQNRKNPKGEIGIIMSKINKQDVIKVLVVELSVYIIQAIYLAFGRYLLGKIGIEITEGLSVNGIIVVLLLVFLLNIIAGIILGAIIRSKKALIYWIYGYLLFCCCYLIYPSGNQVFGWMAVELLPQLIPFLAARLVRYLILSYKKNKSSDTAKIQSKWSLY